jgi:hypothetical protein
LIFIDYHDKYGDVWVEPSQVFCMYGHDKSLHIGACECIVDGRVYSFNPVSVLKSVPESRSPKAIKAAASYITIKHPIPLHMRQQRNWARHSQSRSRIGLRPFTFRMRK